MSQGFLTCVPLRLAVILLRGCLVLVRVADPATSWEPQFHVSEINSLLDPRNFERPVPL